MLMSHILLVAAAKSIPVYFKIYIQATQKKDTSTSIDSYLQNKHNKKEQSGARSFRQHGVRKKGRTTK